MATVEKAPETPRRTTRSTTVQSPQKPIAENEIPSLSHDLLFPGDPIDLATLLSALPGRRSQILELLQVIGPTNSPMLPVLLYGGASTGKTTSILHISRHLKRPFVYVSCRSCYNRGILFGAVLNQLIFRRRNSSNGYSSAKKCERPSDFVNLLRDALSQVIGFIKNGMKKKSGSKEPHGEMVYLVFDNLEVVRSWDENSGVLSLLLRMHEMLRMPEVGLIYISSASPDAYYSSTGSMEPVSVHFPAYTVDDLHSIFMKNQANPKLYSSFLSAVLKPFYRITRRLDELSTVLGPLYQKYCEPLKDLNVVPDEGLKRRLFNNIQSRLAASFNEVFNVPVYFSREGNIEVSRKMGAPRKLVGKDASSNLDLHMSVSAKYLLVSAFLASRNPATLDAALFDSTGGSDNRKRKRKSSLASLEQNDNMTQDFFIKGPGSFPLERMLAIFQCITSVTEGELEEEQIQDETGMGGGSSGLMCDVLLQLSTLCNANFIIKSGCCPLEGSTRYRSTITEELALKRRYSEEIIAKLGSSFSFVPFLVVVGISTYDYIVALREQDQQIAGSGQQSPQMSSVSSLTGMSSASSMNTFHRASWCTPPRLFLEDELDVIPPETGTSTSSVCKKMIAEESAKKSRMLTVKLSPWTLAQLNAVEVSKVAAQARKKSKILQPVRRQEMHSGQKIDSSLGSGSSRMPPRPDNWRRTNKRGQHLVGLPLEPLSNIYASASNSTDSDLAAESSTTLAPLQQAARSAFSTMSFAGIVASSPASSLDSSDLHQFRVSFLHR